MKNLVSFKSSLIMLFQVLFILSLVQYSYQTTTLGIDFLDCFSFIAKNQSSLSEVVYSKTDPNYTYVLDFSIYNRRFLSDSMPKPFYIVAPQNATHIQAAIICSKLNNIQTRTRSGGHDIEGLSHMSDVPFIIIDLFKLNNVTVDLETNTAWVGGGATLGELYYHIANVSDTLAFPAGICPTVGVGGHISGGGIGMLSRKYGLAADQVIDAQLIDARGRVLDRESMGKDLFWALRGGGGNNFGVVSAWKVNLVTIPSNVTVFSVAKNLDENGTKLVYRWQEIASKLPPEILIAVNCSRSGTTLRVQFMAQYLGSLDDLILLMDEQFPELGLERENCLELKWIEAAVRFARYPTGIEDLLNRTQVTAIAYKSKSDYIKEPIPISGLEGMWTWLTKDEAEIGYFLLTASGGRMSEIAEWETPYPHRAGNLYIIQYVVQWEEKGTEAAQKYLDWMTGLYNYTEAYVSKNPREAYVNFRDLAIGRNNAYGEYTSCKQAKVWGRKYYKDNFDRLVYAKTMTDPTNFFRNEQSIPPRTFWNEEHKSLNSM